MCLVLWFLLLFEWRIHSSTASSEHHVGSFISHIPDMQRALWDHFRDFVTLKLPGKCTCSHEGLRSELDADEDISRSPSANTNADNVVTLRSSGKCTYWLNKFNSHGMHRKGWQHGDDNRYTILHQWLYIGAGPKWRSDHAQQLQGWNTWRNERRDQHVRKCRSHLTLWSSLNWRTRYSVYYSFGLCCIISPYSNHAQLRQ